MDIQLWPIRLGMSLLVVLSGLLGTPASEPGPCGGIDVRRGGRDLPH